MKKLYALSFLTVLFLNSFSQTYHPLIRSNTTWDVMHYNYATNSICGYVWGGRFFFDGYDTIINSFQYKIIRSYPVVSASQNPFCGPFSVDTSIGGIAGFMREDTITQRIYVYDQFNNADDLLYDFSLNAGDTLQSNYYAGVGLKLVVDSVSTVTLLTGEIRKIFYLQDNNEYYIEGIGGWQGLNNPLITGLGFGWELRCVMENSITIWNGGCFPIVGIDETLNGNRVNIYPNPLLNNFNLSFPSHKEEGILKIYDVLGNITLEETISALTENKNVDISKLNNGVYFCKISWSDKSENVKIIKE